ncbi:MAG TPA: cation-transporting P-type ATPase, partial [Patescibacteria group bacterium]|nr:cation-transporting P-type ATPase [Patescibacteria group bacterium]
MDEIPKLPYYRMDPAAVLEQLQSQSTGLDAREAAKRLEHYGPNELVRTQHELAIVKFLRQFKNLMVILLLASGSLSLYLRDYETSTILFLIAFINAVIGYRQ